MEQLRIATCRVLPEPDPDEALLLGALAARGIGARMAAWDDPAEPWEARVPTLVRSTWNYHHAPESFAGWIARASSAAPMWNPPDTMRGNLHKRYLLDLAARCVPVVPTVLLGRGSRVALGEVMAGQGWSVVVVKPAVSCASFATIRVGAGDLDAGEAHLRAWLPSRDMLVQPYVPSVEDHGERSLVFIDGEVTHAVRKSPRLAGQDEAVSAAVPVAPDERRLAEDALAPHRDGLLYGRVDVARGDDGRPLIMELELVEPSLFLAQEPPALARLADGLARRLR